RSVAASASYAAATSSRAGGGSLARHAKLGDSATTAPASVHARNCERREPRHHTTEQTSTAGVAGGSGGGDEVDTCVTGSGAAATGSGAATGIAGAGRGSGDSTAGPARSARRVPTTATAASASTTTARSDAKSQWKPLPWPLSERTTTGVVTTGVETWRCRTGGAVRTTFVCALPGPIVGSGFTARRGFCRTTRRSGRAGRTVGVTRGATAGAGAT